MLQPGATYHDSASHAISVSNSEYIHELANTVLSNHAWDSSGQKEANFQFETVHVSVPCADISSSVLATSHPKVNYTGQMRFSSDITRVLAPPQHEPQR